MLTTLIHMIFGLCSYRNQNKNVTDLVCDKYDPERKILDVSSLKNILTKVNVFVDSGKTYMTHKLFKSIEFFTAEVIIRNSIFIANTNDDYLKVLAQEKIHNVIKMYIDIFDENKSELIESLKFRLFQNLCKINNDIYNTFKVINKQICKNLDTDYDPEIIHLDKNFFWYPGIKYSIEKLQEFCVFFSQSRRI